MRPYTKAGVVRMKGGMDWKAISVAEWTGFSDWWIRGWGGGIWGGQLDFRFGDGVNWNTIYWDGEYRRQSGVFLEENSELNLYQVKWRYLRDIQSTYNKMRNSQTLSSGVMTQEAWWPWEISFVNGLWKMKHSSSWEGEAIRRVHPK